MIKKHLICLRMCNLYHISHFLVIFKLYDFGVYLNVQYFIYQLFDKTQLLPLWTQFIMSSKLLRKESMH